MKNHNNNKGSYIYTYKGTTYKVWNNVNTKNGEWYVDIIDSNFSFTESEMYFTFPTKKRCIQRVQFLIDNR